MAYTIILAFLGILVSGLFQYRSLLTDEVEVTRVKKG